jgi:hypothetical protein
LPDREVHRIGEPPEDEPVVQHISEDLAPVFQVLLLKSALLLLECSANLIAARHQADQIR